MIESIALRKFAVSYFLVHPTKPLCNLVDRITTTIKNRFFKGEIVFLKNKELTGRIVETTKTGYIVEIYDDNQTSPQKEEVKAEDLLRKDSATKNEVLGFILSVTRDTPLGRIVANNIIQELGIFKGQKPLKPVEPHSSSYKTEDAFVISDKKPYWQSDAQLEEKEKEMEEVEERRVQGKISEIIKVPSEAWSSPIEDHEVNTKILSTFAEISVFSDFLKMKEFSLSEFVDALFSPEKNGHILVEIFSKLLKSISHERRKSGKEGLKDMVQVASDITYESEGMQKMVEMVEMQEQKENTGFNRIQWFAGDASSKNWQVYMKSFIYDVITVYDIKIKTNEFTPGDAKEQSVESVAMDRLLMISFLMETIVLGVRFRGYYDAAVEEYREKERERHLLQQELKRLKGEILVSEGTQETKELIDAAEKSIKKFNKECKPELIRSRIAKYSDLSFLFVGGELFYEYKGAFRRIDSSEWPTLISAFNIEKKKDGVFIESVKKYLRML
ncbi:hypothetical protein NEMIN01_1802 [Nematocida minor]|uniref:uncharacterized protein n=1 Tax=Nematocida minor TaxID=1912983 RepID=UPI00221E4EB9|nr:uncharacterized protein NEMIN01_1802 [Nematocida minor]KAI5192054.1 hypothetical protein NEMIN01_1802 [Nematocida minor]